MGFPTGNPHGITLSVAQSGITECQSPLQNGVWIGEFSGFAAILEGLRRVILCCRLYS